MESHLYNKNIVLFDGVCNLCNGFIDFVIKRDKSKSIFYSSLQDSASQQFVKEFNIELGTNYSTVYYYRKGVLYSESTAILNILKELNPRYRFLAKACLVIPESIRNFGYKIISRNRYILFGRKDTCRMPSPEELNQFIDLN